MQTTHFHFCKLDRALLVMISTSNDNNVPGASFLIADKKTASKGCDLLPLLVTHN